MSFTGFLNQRAMLETYEAADILVLPSDQDTWGLVVNEAMTCGRGCIVSDRVGCGPDLIVEGRTGFVFPVGNVEALAARMRLIADTPGMAMTMGEQAKTLIVTHSPRAAADALVQAVAAVVPTGFDQYRRDGR
jgi:glycosyltransferase involved in cell wall biosynthesis